MPVTRADAPLRVGQAARVAVHDRVVGHAAGERVVLGAARRPARGRAARPRRRGGPPPRARAARGGGADLDRVARRRCPPREPSARRSSWSAASLIAFRWRSCSNWRPGGAMSGCQRLAIRRRASCTSRLSNGGSSSSRSRCCSTSRTRGHDPTTLATRRRGPILPCAMSSQYIFTMHRLSQAFTRPTRRCSTTSRWPSTRARRSACSATTAPASRRCCGSWPGVDRSTAARPQLAPGRDRGHARAGAAARRVQGRARQRRGRRRRDARRCSTASTSSPPNYSDETADEFGADPGADRRGRRVEPRHAARIRDGRAAPAAAATPT